MYLSGNAVAHVPSITAAIQPLFSSTSVSAVLDLSHNALERIDDQDFDGFVGLSALSLVVNNITYASVAALTSLKHPVLAQIYTTGTPLQTTPCPAGYFDTINTLLAGGRWKACSPCPDGSFCTGSGAIVPCPRGYFSDTPQATDHSECTPCPTGTRNALLGQTSLGCVMCPVGTASNTLAANASSACAKCEPGYYAGSPGMEECLPCPAGSYSSKAAAGSVASCLLCPLNSFSTALAASTNATCASCPSGTSTLTTGASGASACTSLPCGAGSSRDTHGACTPCGSGTYSVGGGCLPCPTGSYALLSGSAACTLCPPGTYSAAIGVSNASACLPCPYGTLCTSERTGCAAVCPAGTLLNPAANVGLSAFTSQCTVPPPTDSFPPLCTRCESGAAYHVCVAGLTESLPLLSALATASPHVPEAQQLAELTAEVPLSKASPFESCGEFVQSALFTVPVANFAAVRTPLLIFTALAAIGLPLLISLLMRRTSPTLGETDGIAAKLKGMDNFSNEHPVARDEVLRNAPTSRGGLFTIAFIISAAGLTASVLTQLFTHTYNVSQAVVNIPQISSTAFTAGVHYGTLSVEVLLVGQYSDASCAGVSITSEGSGASGTAWRKVTTSRVPLADDSVKAVFESPAALATTMACRVRVVCEACRLTDATTLQLSYAWTYQSVAVSIATRNAFPQCSPPFRRLFSAPSATALLATLAISVRVQPVVFQYTGSGALSSSILRDATGHDIVMSGSQATLRADPAVMRPSDVVAFTLAFAPTPYSTQLVVSDSTDALSVITSLLGMVSGLGAAFRFLLRRADKAKMGGNRKTVDTPSGPGVGTGVHAGECGWCGVTRVVKAVTCTGTRLASAAKLPMGTPVKRISEDRMAVVANPLARNSFNPTVATQPRPIANTRSSVARHSMRSGEVA